MDTAHKTKDSSTLSISSPGISSCQEVAEYFRLCHIQCHVTSNDTVLRSDDTNAYRIEKGCQIKFGSHTTTLLTPSFWLALQNRFALTCAHLEVEGKYKGCVYDYFRHTDCPHSTAVDREEPRGRHDSQGPF